MEAQHIKHAPPHAKRQAQASSACSLPPHGGHAKHEMRAGSARTTPILNSAKPRGACLTSNWPVPAIFASSRTQSSRLSSALRPAFEAVALHQRSEALLGDAQVGACLLDWHVHQLGAGEAVQQMCELQGAAHSTAAIDTAQAFKMLPMVFAGLAFHSQVALSLITRPLAGHRFLPTGSSWPEPCDTSL